MRQGLLRGSVYVLSLLLLIVN